MKVAYIVAYAGCLFCCLWGLPIATYFVVFMQVHSSFQLQVQEKPVLLPPHPAATYRPLALRLRLPPPIRPYRPHTNQRRLPGDGIQRNKPAFQLIADAERQRIKN